MLVLFGQRPQNIKSTIIETGFREYLRFLMTLTSNQLWQQLMVNYYWLLDVSGIILIYNNNRHTLNPGLTPTITKGTMMWRKQNRWSNYWASNQGHTNIILHLHFPLSFSYILIKKQQNISPSWQRLQQNNKSEAKQADTHNELACPAKARVY